ncbi:RluA family pseudouridine synthase [Candidatus Auribacterota bacterium]
MAAKKNRLKGIEIIHEDRDILVVDKPAGLLTIATDMEQEKTAYHILTDYVRKGCYKSRNRVYIVHRLDKGTSGVLIFAKSEEVKRNLQDQWANTEKKYLTLVHGGISPKEGTISSYLAENINHKMFSTHNASKGKLSHTAYKVLKETKGFSLLEISLITGRKNQIRVHLADKGCPVVGDKKYGNARDPHKRLALHAKSITFNHPHSGKQLTFDAKIPGWFNGLNMGSGLET